MNTFLTSRYGSVAGYACVCVCTLVNHYTCYEHAWYCKCSFAIFAVFQYGFWHAFVDFLFIIRECISTHSIINVIIYLIYKWTLILIINIFIHLKTSDWTRSPIVTYIVTHLRFSPPFFPPCRTAIICVYNHYPPHNWVTLVKKWSQTRACYKL